MQILFVNSHHINATFVTVKTWLSDPARFKQLSPITSQLNWQVFTGSKLVGYRSEDHQYQLIFALRETPLGTQVDQTLLVTKAPALPRSVLNPLIDAAFASNLHQLDQLLAEQ
ncbi:hypothetical protein [Lacticaseibacillus sp. N501-2]|uniref:hypothetical protein n=1 Tax=Lacticaseibacillus salsurae TaxID=3367729 RepID=UPI0038B288CE